MFFTNQSKFLFVIFILFTAMSCKKEETEKKVPELSTVEITEITDNSAISGGSITSDFGFTITSRGVVWSIVANPTISDNKTMDGAGAGNFTSNMTGLLPDTEYFVRAYAINSEGTGYGSTMIFRTLAESSNSTFTDNRDDNVYQTVEIGDQIWMAENLRYLPSVVGPETSSQTIPYYYIYGYYGTNVNEAKATDNYTTYGVLYNWTAAMDGDASSSSNPSGVQGICPNGWHLPSDAEWTELTEYLGGTNIAGGKMKEVGTIHWNSPNTGASNESGFNALPAGYKYTDNNFHHLGYYATWWSSTSSSYNIYDRFLMHNSQEVFKSESNSNNAWSIRCIKN